MENRELKPCPFCGREPQLKKSTPPELSSEWVECINPYCGLWDKFTVEEWNTRKHPGGGLVSLDKRGLDEILVKYNEPVNQTGPGDVYGIYGRNLKKVRNEIMKRFGQPKIKLPARKEESRLEYPTRKQMTDIGFSYGYNQALDDISKLNSTEG